MSRILTDGVVVLRFHQDPDDPNFWGITSHRVGESERVTSWHYREAVNKVFESRKRMDWIEIQSEEEVAEALQVRRGAA